MDETPVTESAPCLSEVQRSSPHDAIAEQKLAKRAEIEQACASEDVAKLRELATAEHGLISDDLRRSSWSLLLGCNSHDGDVEMQPPWEKLPRHRDEDQVKLDVDRAFVYYPHDETKGQIDSRRQDLQDLIVETLRRHPFLCYFQGYHDIVQVLMLVLGRSGARDAVARVSLLRIRDFMLPTMGPSISHLRLLPALLRAADDEVAEHLSHTEPFFALAATITLYAHDIQEYGDIARLYDFLLSREAVISIYLFAVIIVARREELLEIEHDEPEMMHSVLSKLPKPLNLESLIAKTMVLFESHPPSALPAFRWPWISSNSVLKSTQDVDALALQTLGDGKKLFMRQSREVRVLQSLSQIRSNAKALRRPAAAVSLALIVAIVSYWLRKDSAWLWMDSIWPRLRRIF